MIQMNSKANILIDKDGHARLTDFVLSSIIRGDDSIRSPQDSTIAGTTMWAAPEVLQGGASTKEGDVFTFAMVAVEVWTQRVLYGHFLNSSVSDRRWQGAPHSVQIFKSLFGL
jgi:serine/threonine protein kinase